MECGAAEILERVRRFAMPEGDVEPREVRFAQQGEMRLRPDGPWLPFRAEQRMAGDGIDFRWRAWFRMGFAPVRVIDAFEDGAGALTASALGIVPLARGRGADFDRGEAQRGLAECPWRPFAFGRTKDVAWASGDPGTLRATYEDGRVRASVELSVDRDGQVTGGSAVRPMLAGKTAVDTEWRGAYADYRRFGRVRIPTSAEVAWILPEGPFVYWRGRIVAYPEF
jgi:hypothetical protein